MFAPPEIAHHRLDPRGAPVVDDLFVDEYRQEGAAVGGLRARCSLGHALGGYARDGYTFARGDAFSSAITASGTVIFSR